MDKKVRNVLYVIIIVICVAAIIVGVYEQFFKKEKDDDLRNNPFGGNTLSNSVTYEEIKQGFRDLFTNEFNTEYDDSNIEKEDNSKPLVYTAIDLEEEKEDKYDVDVSVPFINIKGVNYNEITDNVFVEKLNNIVYAESYTICDINYTAYINNDILSVAIMASIKEGDNAQRIIIESYNYNLKTKKDVSINDIIEERGLDTKAVENRIKTIVNKAANDAESMQSTGYNVYSRDTESEIYKISGIDNFIQGPEGELYIIYAYGNNAFTSEMDIIQI